MEVSIKQACQIVMASAATRKTSWFFMGMPGIGKTMGTAAELAAAGFEVMTVRVQNLPVEDTARAMVIDKENLTMRWAVPEDWRPRPVGKKWAIILDELFKAPDDVQNAFLPLIHGHEYMGLSYEANPPVVILTGNNPGFRLGDRIKPHILNRVACLNIAPPKFEEAQQVMLDLNFAAEIIGWVKAQPQALLSYDPGHAKMADTEKDLYFGFDDAQPLRPFCSMRSLEMASNIVGTMNLDSELMLSALEGTIGAKAARSLKRFMSETTVRIPITEILADPKGARVPETLFDQRMVALNCASSTSKENIPTLWQYIQRMPGEVRDVYVNMLTKRSNFAQLIPVFPPLGKAAGNLLGSGLR